MNKLVQDANTLIKQSEDLLRQSEKREHIIDKYFSFFENDKSLDAKVKAFKRMPWNKNSDLDEKLVDYFVKTGKEINKENVSSVISALNQYNRQNSHKNQQEYKPSVVQQPQPAEEPMYKKLFKNAPQRPQSAPVQTNQQKYKDLDIPQEPKAQVPQSYNPNQSQRNSLNNSFTSNASTLNSSFTSTASLNNIQKQNTQKEVQTQSKLQQVKVWFSEKFNKLTNLFSLKRDSEIPSNITNSINISTQKDNKFQAPAGQVVKNEKGNYR